MGVARKHTFGGLWSLQIKTNPYFNISFFPKFKSEVSLQGKRRNEQENNAGHIQLFPVSQGLLLIEHDNTLLILFLNFHSIFQLLFPSSAWVPSKALKISIYLTYTTYRVAYRGIFLIYKEDSAGWASKTIICLITALYFKEKILDRRFVVLVFIVIQAQKESRRRI